MKHARSFLKTAIAWYLLALAAASASAAYPEKPIHIIVPYPPGGLTDAVARQVGKALSERVQAAGGHRERRRGRRQHRRRQGGEVARRRLHAVHRQQRDGRHQHADLQEARVRSDQGPGADRAGRGEPDHSRRASFPAGKERDRADRLCQGAARPAELRLDRHGRPQPPGGRAAEELVRHTGHPHPLQGHRPGADATCSPARSSSCSTTRPSPTSRPRNCARWR